MTKIKCRCCEHIENLEWKISAFGLIDALIKFECIDCGTQTEVTIIFPKKKKGKPKIKIEYNTDYIG